MFFTALNQHQRVIAAGCILVIGIVQITLDGWTLYKVQQHEELILFLSGNSIPSSVMHTMTYEQALSYFSKLKQFLSPNLIEILDTLQMTSILGLVAGLLQLFSSTAAIVWQGLTVDVFWLISNFIVAIFLSVAVAYISIHMIRDVPYHQVLLTVTALNLFILIHIWIVNLIALIHSKCSREDNSSSPPQQSETLAQNESQAQLRTDRNEENTLSVSTGINR